MPSDEDPEDYAVESKLRRISLLEDQLDDVKQELEERNEIHENILERLNAEEDFSQRKLETVKKLDYEDKERRKKDLENRIEDLRKDKWREQVKAWRDSQDLLKEARQLKRELQEMKHQLKCFKHFLSEGEEE